MLRICRRKQFHHFWVLLTRRNPASICITVACKWSHVTGVAADYNDNLLAVPLDLPMRQFHSCWFVNYQHLLLYFTLCWPPVRLCIFSTWSVNRFECWTAWTTMLWWRPSRLDQNFAARCGKAGDKMRQQVLWRSALLLETTGYGALLVFAWIFLSHCFHLWIVDATAIRHPKVLGLTY